MPFSQQVENTDRMPSPLKEGLQPWKKIPSSQLNSRLPAARSLLSSTTLDQRLVHLQELTSSLIPCTTWQPDVAGELNHAEQGQEQHWWNCHVTPAVLSLCQAGRRNTMQGMPRRRGGMVGHRSNTYLQGLMALIPLSTACIWKQHSILSALLPLLLQWLSVPRS